MSITSETQRKYDPNKGGFSYYTLFRADKGERPHWAQDGDMLEEFGEGGKAYVCSRDAKGRIKWTEKAGWDRQTGGGSGGELPADFPAEGIANADKFLGFDENGDYTALDAPSGAEKFVVTLTADDSGAETVWTADKTAVEIYEAYAAGADCICKIPYDDDQLGDLRLFSAFSPEEGVAVVYFNGAWGEEYLIAFNILIATEDSNDACEVYQISLPQGEADGDTLVWDADDGKWKADASPNAPLIVTMTAGETAGTFVGNKTYEEVFNAMRDGRRCVIPITIAGLVADAAQVLDCIAVYSNGTPSEYMLILPSFTDGGAVLATFSGAPSDYVTLTIG